MRFFKIFSIVSVLVVFVFLSVYYFYFFPENSTHEQLFNIEIPTTRALKQEISATGTLKLKDQVKIASLVSGRIKAIHVEENDPVKEGQLLIEIDTGLEDTKVREALGAYEKALAELEYQEVYFKRQKQLSVEQFISDAALQEAKCHYQKAMADVKSIGASYEREVIAYQNTHVYAPVSGVVIQVDVTKGVSVASDMDGGALLALAPDTKLIELALDINERDIGQIRQGQKLKMAVETYPHRLFESAIQSISLTPKDENEKECNYLAKAYVDNADLLLRPGMNVSATIDVASIDSALAITSRAFTIKRDHLQSISKILNYSINPIEKQDKEALLKAHPDQHLQFVWLACENCFQEVPLELGISDGIHFQVKSGLSEKEKLVVEVLEEDQMQKLYEKIYRKF